MGGAMWGLYGGPIWGELYGGNYMKLYGGSYMGGYMGGLYGGYMGGDDHHVIFKSHLRFEVAQTCFMLQNSFHVHISFSYWKFIVSKVYHSVQALSFRLNLLFLSPTKRRKPATHCDIVSTNQRACRRLLVRKNKNINRRINFIAPPQ